MTAQAEFHQRDRDLHPPAHTPVYKTRVYCAHRASPFGLCKTRIGGHRPDISLMNSVRSITIVSIAPNKEAIGEQTIVHGNSTATTTSE